MQQIMFINSSPDTGFSFTVADADLAARVALACAGVAGEVPVAIAIDAAGGAARLVSAIHDETDRVLPLTERIRARIRTLGTGANVARVLQHVGRHQVQVLTPLGPRWPERVSCLGRAAPLLLWVSGDPAILSGELIAITGDTVATGSGARMALELGTGLGQRGWAVAAHASPAGSIDQFALRGAAAMGGRTLLVSVQPRRALVRDGAVVVGEVLPGVTWGLRESRRARFLLAALAEKTILVEADISSPAGRTAEAAYGLGRPVGIALRAVDDAARIRSWAGWDDVQVVRSIDEADRLR